MSTWTERAKAAISQTGQSATAKTDETAFSRLLAVSSVPTVAASAMPELLSSILTVLTPSVLEKPESSTPVSQDPERDCLPHSRAMNEVQTDSFAARLRRFTDKGLTQSDSEALADKLVRRDLERDDRRVCMECKHFAGHGAASWRCGNWQAAGFVHGAREAQLPADLVVQLQRCDGFSGHPTYSLRRNDDEHYHY